MRKNHYFESRNPPKETNSKMRQSTKPEIQNEKRIKFWETVTNPEILQIYTYMSVNHLRSEKYNKIDRLLGISVFKIIMMMIMIIKIIIIMMKEP